MQEEAREKRLGGRTEREEGNTGMMCSGAARPAPRVP